MSILIKGATMPKWCIECPCCDKDLQICEVLKRDIPVFEDKLPGCPLVEIPPHGRLIDADKFKQDNEVYWECDFIHPKYEDTLQEIVERAPTVIESEHEDV